MGKDGSSARRPTNVTLPDALLREARALNVNMSQAAEQGIAAEVKAAKSARWQAENRAAMDVWNEYVEREGLPLEQFRLF